MKRIIAILAVLLLLCMTLFVGCGNSSDTSSQSEEKQVQEESDDTTDSSESDTSFEYVAEGGHFTRDTGFVLENIDKRMASVSEYHVLQDGPSVYVHWVDDQDVSTAISCNKADGQTPVDSSDEIPGGIFMGTKQPTGEVSDYAINAAVYVLQTLDANLASDESLYDKVNGMASEAETMKKEVGDGGYSKSSIGDFDVTLLTQEAEDGMTVIFLINQR